MKLDCFKLNKGSKFFFTPCQYVILLWIVLMFIFACEPSKKKITDVTTPEVKVSDTIADIIDDGSRLGWQKPQVVLDMIGDMEEKSVLEIGAGNGYFTFRLVPRVGKLIATDINVSMTRYLDSVKVNFLPEKMRNKLDVRLVRPEDPGVKKGEVDIVFISNTYAYINNRSAYLEDVYNLIEPSALIVIVDFKKRIIPVGPSVDDKIPLYEVENELKSAGFSIVSADDTSLPYQYIIIAEKE